MATHSSVLAWRIPGMGSHSIGHDWSDLAVAASAPGFPDSSDSKDSSSFKAGDLGWEDPLEKGNGSPLQHSCLENFKDRGAWWTIQSMESQRVGHNWATKHTAKFLLKPAAHVSCLKTQPISRWNLHTHNPPPPKAAMANEPSPRLDFGSLWRQKRWVGACSFRRG